MSVHVIQGGSLYIQVGGEQEIPIQGSQALFQNKGLPMTSDLSIISSYIMFTHVKVQYSV